MFLTKKEYNKWYYSLFAEEQKERVRKWREKQKLLDITNKKKNKKEVVPMTVHRGNFTVRFN